MIRNVVVLVLFLLLLHCGSSAQAAKYKKKYNSRSCRPLAVKSLGFFYNHPRRCGDAAIRDPTCTGTVFMFSHATWRRPWWYCVCCANKPSSMTEAEAYPYDQHYEVWEMDLGLGASVPPRQNACPTNKVQLEVHVHTDSFPVETAWSVTNDCDEAANAIKKGKYEQAHNKYVHKKCVDPGQYTFTISDWFGDGICCGFDSGNYTVKYGGEVVAKGGEFQYKEATTFGTSCPKTVLRLPAYGCDRFQDKNLGTSFSNPDECAKAARADSACRGNEIMWSPYSYSWGCRCCSPKPKGSDEDVYSANPNWDIYQYDE